MSTGFAVIMWCNTCLQKSCRWQSVFQCHCIDSAGPWNPYETPVWSVWKGFHLSTSSSPIIERSESVNHGTMLRLKAITLAHFAAETVCSHASATLISMISRPTWPYQLPHTHTHILTPIQKGCAFDGGKKIRHQTKDSFVAFIGIEMSGIGDLNKLTFSESPEASRNDDGQRNKLRVILLLRYCICWELVYLLAFFCCCYFL